MCSKIDKKLCIKEGFNGEIYWPSKKSDESTCICVLNKDMTEITTWDVPKSSALDNDMKRPFSLELYQLDDSTRMISSNSERSDAWSILKYYTLESTGKMKFLLKYKAKRDNQVQTVVAKTSLDKTRVQIVIRVETEESFDERKHGSETWIAEEFSMDEIREIKEIEEG